MRSRVARSAARRIRSSCGLWAALHMFERRLDRGRPLEHRGRSIGQFGFGARHGHSLYHAGFFEYGGRRQSGFDAVFVFPGIHQFGLVDFQHAADLPARWGSDSSGSFVVRHWEGPKSAGGQRHRYGRRRHCARFGTHGWTGLVYRPGRFLCFPLVRRFSAGALLARILNAPKHEDVICPTCHNSPILGDFWECDKCHARFDTFAERGICPSCSNRFAETVCPSCGEAHPIEDWYEGHRHLER